MGKEKKKERVRVKADSRVKGDGRVTGAVRNVDDARRGLWTEMSDPRLHALALNLAKALLPRAAPRAEQHVPVVLQHRLATRGDLVAHDGHEVAGGSRV